MRIQVAEFVVAVMGIVMIVKMGLLFMIRDYGVGVRGDSITALTWISKEKYRGLSVANAAMVFAKLGVAYGSVVSDAGHLSAADNWRADDLSRISSLEKTLPQVMLSIGYGGIREIDLMGDKEVINLLRYMDPGFVVESDEEFRNFWEGAMTAVQS